MNKYLEGCQLVRDNVYRIRESFILSKENSRKLPITESTSLIESNGKSHKCISIYEFSVWKLGEKNLNERIYGEKIADYVIENFPSSLGLMNHPEGDVSNMKDVFAVEKNPKKRDGWLKIECWLIGPHGQLVEDILQAGGKIGGSSSVLGSLSDDGEVQLDENFSLDRYLDIVDQPSNAYFNTLESSLNESTNKPTTNNLTILNNDNKKLVDNIIINEDKKMSNSTGKKVSYLEKNFIDYVNRKANEIGALGNIEDKINQFTELLECFNDDDVKNFNVASLKENVVKKLDESKIEFKVLADKGKETDSLKETKKQLKEKLEKLEKDYKKLNENFIKVCNIAEESKSFFGKYKNLYEIEKATVNGKIDAKDFLNVLAYSKELEEKVVEYNSQLKSIQESKKVIEAKLNDKIREDKIKVDKIKKLIANKKIKEASKLKQVNLKKQQESAEMEALKKQILAEKQKNELNIRNIPEVTDYYVEMVGIHPHLRNYKQKFLSCKTVQEAYKVFLDVKDNDADNNIVSKKINEKVEKTKEEVSFIYTSLMDEAGKGFKY
jgi:hypothetical protein